MQSLLNTLRLAALAGALLLLSACASRAPQDAALQGFEAAFATGSEKFASGDLAQAERAFAQAERLAVLYDRRALRIQALFALGAVAATREQDPQARQAYTQALDEATALADAHSIAVAHAGVADAQRRADEFVAALQSYALALQSVALTPGSDPQLQARLGRALVWHAMADSRAAAGEWKALEDVARAKHSAVLPAVLANRASVLRDQGDLPAAVAKAEEALALDRAAANPFALAADLELLGRLYAASSRTAEAKTSWERARRIVQTTGQAGAAARLQALLGGVR